MELVTLGWFAVGLVLPIVGAETLGRGASRSASAVGISPVMVAVALA